MQQSYGYIFGILRRNKGLLILTAAVAAVEAGLQIAYPWLTRLQVEALEGRAELTSLLQSPAAVFMAVVVMILVVQLMTTLVGGLGRLSETYVRERMEVDTDRLLYDKMEQLDAGFLESARNRKLIYLFFDISTLPHSFVTFLSSVLKTGIALAAILPILALTDLTVCAVIAGFGVLQLWLLRIRMRRENAFRLYKERAMAGINELIFLLRHRFHQLLRASGEERIMPKFWDKRREAVALEVRQTKISISFEIINHLIENLSLFAAAVVIGKRVLDGQLSIGAFIMVTLYTAQLQAGLSEINANIGEWYRLRATFLQLGFFLTMRPRVDVSRSEAPADSLVGDVVLDDVHFRYPNLQDEEREYIGFLVKQLALDNTKREVWPGDYELVKEWEQLAAENRDPFEPVLRGVSGRFARGKITALVGRNGSGKTTLMKLLQRSYDPEQGTIDLADRPLKRLTPRYLRHLFSMVTQEPFLLESFSIRDNALLGCDPSLTDEEIWSVLDRLGLGHAVRAFPGGLDSLLGDEVGLSGGQSQLLVIARTLLQRRPFVILDEGTNQLDAERELAIIEILQEIKQEATVIIITHRMTTARKADQILVLDQGRITQQGTHAELVELPDGLYRQFWDIQVVT